MLHVHTFSNVSIICLCCIFCFFHYCRLFRSWGYITKMLRKGKSITGGRDLAMSAAYTSQFASALFSAWFRAWVLRDSAWLRGCCSCKSAGRSNALCYIFVVNLARCVFCFHLWWDSRAFCYPTPVQHSWARFPNDAGWNWNHLAGWTNDRHSFIFCPFHG